MQDWSILLTFWLKKWYMPTFVQNPWSFISPLNMQFHLKSLKSVRQTWWSWNNLPINNEPFWALFKWLTDNQVFNIDFSSMNEWQPNRLSDWHLFDFNEKKKPHIVSLFRWYQNKTSSLCMFFTAVELGYLLSLINMIIFSDIGSSNKHHLQLSGSIPRKQG